MASEHGILPTLQVTDLETIDLNEQCSTNSIHSVHLENIDESAVLHSVTTKQLDRPALHDHALLFNSYVQIEVYLYLYTKIEKSERT